MVQSSNEKNELAVELEVVGQLVRQSAAGQGFTLRRSWKAALPARDRIVDIVEWIRCLLFPGYFGDSEIAETSKPYHIGSILDRVQRELREQIRRGFCFACKKDDPSACAECADRPQQATRAFLVRLPQVQRLLFQDVTAAYQGDPAATSPDEAVLCYPGILAITNYRIAHELYRLGVPLVPRMITEYAHGLTGIDIHPGAAIGEAFFIDHGTGVVVGETCEIGRRVRIYQGVTLGAKSFALDENGNPVKGVPRHPIVEDDVIIYSGATVLGRVHIGRASVIGGNVWLTHSVPEGSVVTQAQPGDEGSEGRVRSQAAPSR